MAIFKDLARLSPEYVPKKLVHRREELKRLKLNIGDISSAGIPQVNTIIFGESGSGKTVTVRYLFEADGGYGKSFKTETFDGIHIYRGKNVDVVHVSAKHFKTELSVLTALVRGLANHDFPTRGVRHDEVFSAFASIPKNLMAIVDEIDEMKEPERSGLIYTLSRKGAGIIAISNRVGAFSHLESKAMAALPYEKIIFSMYSAKELRDIVAERVKEAFVEGTVDKSVIDGISAKAAMDDGKAWSAIRLLRLSGHCAANRNAERVELQDLDEAERRFGINEAVEMVRKTTLQKKIALLAILNTNRGEGARVGAAYATYKRFCGISVKPVLSLRRFQQFIKDFEGASLLESRRARWGSAGRGGVDKMVRLTDVGRKAVQQGVEGTPDAALILETGREKGEEVQHPEVIPPMVKLVHPSSGRKRVGS